MPTGSDYSYGKATQIHFTVKNVSPNKKTLKLFGVKVRYGGRIDLLNLPYVSESDIRDSLVKGELSRKIRTGDIQIVDSSIDLLQFDESQRNFIRSAYIDPLVDLPGTNPTTQCGGGGTADLGLFKISESTLGTKGKPDPNNWGGSNMYLDPGGESSNYVSIPNTINSDLGEPTVISGSAGVRITNNSGTWNFNAEGIVFPDNTVQTTAYPGAQPAVTYYVMGNIDGNVVTSTDGLNWSSPIDIGININHLATDGNKIVTIYGSDIGYTDFSSPSTVTVVEAKTPSLFSIIMTQIIYGGGKFVVSGYYTDSYRKPAYGYSSDGVNWTFKIIEDSDLANILANENSENCEFSDIDYNGSGYNFGVVSNSVGGGVYITDLSSNSTASNYFGMVPGNQVAWQGNAWYYYNTDAGSGFNLSVDPRLGVWTGPYDPWSNWLQDVGYPLPFPDPASDTFSGGNGTFAIASWDGQVAYSIDYGQNWNIIVPIPYTGIVTNIDNITSVLTYTMNIHPSNYTQDIIDNEKIIISGSSVGGYDGTYYWKSSTGELYTDQALTTLANFSGLDPWAGTANITLSHGTYIDAMDYANDYFYIGNDDEQIARSLATDMISWEIVDDQGDLYEYWNDFYGYTKPAVSNVSFPYIELTNQAINVNYYAGPVVSFTKTNYGSEVDNIDTDVSITRGDYYAIYNPELEPGWSDDLPIQSPKNTLWNKDGWGDLTNLDQRTYVSFYEVNNQNIGNNVLSPNFIMKDTINNKYYKVDFTVWGNANSGAPVTYTRQQVDAVTGADIGGLVTFTKPGYADPFLVYDAVDSGLNISRASNQGIFNISLESGWADNSSGDEQSSPKGTQWNVEGWGDLSNVKARNYTNFVDAFNYGLGEKIVGTECIMKDTINDKYYAIKFTSWTGNGMGGGFAYTRQLINPDVMFVHSTNGSEVDDIAPGVGITRDYNGGIYNPYDEGSWDDAISPGGTLWNFNGHHDLSDVQSRVYTPFFQAIGYYIGNKIDGSEAVMKVISTGEYYAIKFMSWQQGGGGAFSYVRTLIDLSKLNEGIRFPDGTVQKTAVDKIVKFNGPAKRKIEEWCGYKSINISQATSYSIDTTLRNNATNTSNIYVNVESEEVFNNFSNGSIRNISVSLDNGYTWQPVRYGGGGSGGGWGVSLVHIYEYQVFNGTAGDSVKIKYWRGGEPQVWFDPDESPGGIGDFRGATIEYHAYSANSGTVIGQIIISRDAGHFNITHSESNSGSDYLSRLILWNSQNYQDITEGKISAFRKDGDSDTIKIQWKATMFYGVEFY